MTAAPPTPSAQQRERERAAQVPSAIQKRWTYLNRIRQGDAFSNAIARTMVNDRNQLGVVLYEHVAPEQVGPLLKQVLAEMAQEFPQQDMTMVAYKTGTPPHELGTAQLDGKTGEAIYTPL